MLLGTALALAQPSPPTARANPICDVGTGPIDTVTGAVGFGNPAGDACNTATDPALGLAEQALDPLKGAVSSIGDGVFRQITSWAADGAIWLVSEVVELTNRTTTPDLLSKGFIRQYRQMALIATLLATLMLIFAVIESLGRGDPGMLGRVFLINVPLAAIATSAAYVVVQLLIALTDGLSHTIALSGAGHTREFFEGAIHALAQTGGSVGENTGAVGPGEANAVGKASGQVAVPLFVGFIAAIIAAFAAFFVWIELLMRDAAIYVVALFMPLALAAAIWPRWSSALRRTAELIVVVVFSKFVIVAIISLAAGLLASGEGGIEHVLAAGALLLLACFSPLALFRFVPIAEGTLSAVHNRRSAAGGAVRGLQLASSSQMMRQSARANWALGGARTVTSGTSGGSAGGSPSSAGSGGRSGTAAATGRAAGAGKSAGGGAAAGPAAAAAAAPGAGARAAKVATSHATAATGAPAGGAPSARSPSREECSSSGRHEAPSSRPPAGQDPLPGMARGSEPEPAEARGASAPGPGEKPPRPAGEISPAEGKGHGGR